MSYKTRQVAHLLNCTYYRIIAAIRGGKLQPPPKDYSGDYVWDESGIEAARLALATDRRRKAVSA